MPSKVYPRPLGGPEPSAQGASDNIPMSNHSLQPEGGIYDYKMSLVDYSMADLKKGYCPKGRLDGARSDPPDDRFAQPKPRT
jgi:hypothetical protein